MNKLKLFVPIRRSAPLLLCAFALNTRADLPATAVSPRNSIMTTSGTNTTGVLTLVPTNGLVSVGTYTNVILTAAFQHEMSCTTQITATNAVPNGTNTVGTSSVTYTNYFDLAKVVNTNGVYTTNWTTTHPIVVTGTFGGLQPAVQSATINHTNFDGFELIRLSLIGHNAANNYSYTVILGQTP